MQVETLELQSEKNRKRLVEIVYKAKAGHIGGDLSCLNVLTALYFDIMRVWPDKPKETKRDRFVMSKGHCVEALYVTLEAKGFISRDDNRYIRRVRIYFVRSSYYRGTGY